MISIPGFNQIFYILDEVSATVDSRDIHPDQKSLMSKPPHQILTLFELRSSPMLRFKFRILSPYVLNIASDRAAAVFLDVRDLTVCQNSMNIIASK